MSGAVLASLALYFMGAPGALAQPDQSGSATIEEDQGFPPICNQPCYTAEKSFEVYLDGNASVPAGPNCPAGEHTYLYQLTHTGGAGPNIPDITEFELMVETDDVSSAGFIPGPGVSPSSTAIGTNDVVSWQFNPGIGNGQTTVQLFVCSPRLPGNVDDNTVSTSAQFSLDASGTCVGPLIQACELQVDKTCCVPQPPMPGVDICQGKVVRMVLEYTDQDCSASNNEQGGKAKCSGDPNGEPVSVILLDDADKIGVSPSSGILVGDEVTFTALDGDLPSNTEFSVVGPAMSTQLLEIHTSCSKALHCDDQFGSMKLVELETTEGGVVTCTPPDTEGTACAAPGFQEGTPCDSRLTEAVFEYTGEACQVPLPNPQDDKAVCNGDPAGAEPVSVVYTGKDPDKITVSPASGIEIGDLFRVTATGRDEMHSNTKLLVQSEGGVLQSLEIHTSCSQPLSLGDEFGSLRLVEFTTKDGGTKALADPGAPIFADACEVPLAPAQPHCTSKVRELGLAYIRDALGEGCTVSNSQDGKGICMGVADPGQPVSITITKDADEVEAVPDVGINQNDIVSIRVNDGSNLHSSTEFTVSGPGGAQAIEIHTSCSQPLNLGDRFGSFVVFSMDREDEGVISLGGVIEYQYKVTNPNASTVDNISVEDDKAGTIASGLSLPPGGMTTLFDTRTLFGTTTNVATVSGDVEGQACTEATDQVTVEVIVPPQGSFECSKPIDELTMIWDGTETIRVKAWKGDVGSTLLADIDNVMPGDEVTVSGFAGSSNDVFWEIFEAGTSNLIGESEFHLSCSDDEMNGVEDCGKPEGNGKSNDGSLINSWLFEGMVDSDETLDCTGDDNVCPCNCDQNSPPACWAACWTCN